MPGFRWLDPPLTLGSKTEDDVWAAISKKAEEKSFGTSKQDIDEYAAVGGGVAGAAACTIAGGGVGAIAAPLCAEIGSIIASSVMDAIQSIGAALFGGTKLAPGPANLWNPAAAHAITGIVKALRKKSGARGWEGPPGGSFRNYPEWDVVAEAWSRHVNEFLVANGSTVRWFNDGAGDVDRKEIQNKDSLSGQLLVETMVKWDHCANEHLYGTSSLCTMLIDIGNNKNSVMAKAMVQATQQTMSDVLAPAPSPTSPTTSSSTKVVKVAATAGVLYGVWWLLKTLVKV